MVVDGSTEAMAQHFAHDFFALHQHEGAFVDDSCGPPVHAAPGYFTSLEIALQGGFQRSYTPVMGGGDAEPSTATHQQCTFVLRPMQSGLSRIYDLTIPHTLRADSAETGGRVSMFASTSADCSMELSRHVSQWHSRCHYSYSRSCVHPMAGVVPFVTFDYSPQRAAFAPFCYGLVTQTMSFPSPGDNSGNGGLPPLPALVDAIRSRASMATSTEHPTTYSSRLFPCSHNINVLASAQTLQPQGHTRVRLLSPMAPAKKRDGRPPLLYVERSGQSVVLVVGAPYAVENNTTEYEDEGNVSITPGVVDELDDKWWIQWRKQMKANVYDPFKELFAFIADALLLSTGGDGEEVSEGDQGSLLLAERRTLGQQARHLCETIVVAGVFPAHKFRLTHDVLATVDAAFAESPLAMLFSASCKVFLQPDASCIHMAPTRVFPVPTGPASFSSAVRHTVGRVIVAENNPASYVHASLLSVVTAHQVTSRVHMNVAASQRSFFVATENVNLGGRFSTPQFQADDEVVVEAKPPSTEFTAGKESTVAPFPSQEPQRYAVHLHPAEAPRPFTLATDPTDCPSVVVHVMPLSEAVLAAEAYYRTSTSTVLQPPTAIQLAHAEPMVVSMEGQSQSQSRPSHRPRPFNIEGSFYDRDDSLHCGGQIQPTPHQDSLLLDSSSPRYWWERARLVGVTADFRNLMCTGTECNSSQMSPGLKNVFYVTLFQ